VGYFAYTMHPEALVSSGCIEMGLGVSSSQQRCFVERSSTLWMTGHRRIEFVDCFSNLDFTCGTRFIVDNIAFRDCFVEWNSVHMRLRQTAYSHWESSSTSL
jgi:hypothetical protein